MEHLNCLVRSPEDLRDWKYDKVVSTSDNFPETFDMRNKLLPVRDQGKRGTCAAFSAACLKEYHETLDNEEYSGYMSPDSVYFYRENKPQEGMFLRDTMKILQKFGTAREGFLPYGPKEPSSLNKETIEDAARFKVNHYAQVTTIEGCKKALMNEGPLIVAFPVYGGSPFWRPYKGLLGGHAVTCVGWDSTGFILRNSWGSSWNGNGYIIWPYSEFGMQWEIWSAVDDETPWIDIPEPIVPTPSPPKPAPKPKPKPRPKPKPKVKPKIKHVKRAVPKTKMIPRKR